MDVTGIIWTSAYVYLVGVIFSLRSHLPFYFMTKADGSKEIYSNTTWYDLGTPQRVRYTLIILGSWLSIIAMFFHNIFMLFKESLWDEWQESRAKKQS